MAGEHGKNAAPKYLLAASDLAGFAGRAGAALIDDLAGDDPVLLPNRKTALMPDAVKTFLQTRGVDYSFTVVAHTNLKGGVGKTTMTITAATRAAQYGFRTCIIDLDPQASATLSVGRIPDDDAPIFRDIWERPEEMTMASLQRIQDNLFILPSSLDNTLLDLNLVNPRQQKNAVHDVCGVLRANGFDLVVIDCPPNLGTSVISSVCAADKVVIPVCNDPFSLKGLELTLNEITSICQTFNLEPPQIMVLYTNFDRRIKASTDVLERLRTRYGEYLLPSIIRTSTEFTKSITKHETVFASHQKSPVRDECDQYVRHLLGMETKGGDA